MTRKLLRGNNSNHRRQSSSKGIIHLRCYYKICRHVYLLLGGSLLLTLLVTTILVTSIHHYHEILQQQQQQQQHGPMVTLSPSSTADTKGVPTTTQKKQHFNPISSSVLSTAWYSKTYDCSKVDDASILSNNTTNHKLSEAIMKIPIVGTLFPRDDEELQTPVIMPSWLQQICPDVYRHFEMFPSFQTNTIQVDENNNNKTIHVPVLTTQQAAIGVCTIQWIQSIATRRLKVPMYLHAGSHLGAILHGQPIPWDDDFDVLMPYESRFEFLNICQTLYGKTNPIHHHHHYHPKEDNVTLNCIVYHNSFLKVWIDGPFVGNYVQKFPGEGNKNKQNNKIHRRRRYRWPFVDIFFYDINATHVNEIKTFDNHGEPSSSWSYGVRISKTIFYPIWEYYFGGIRVLGSSFKYVLKGQTMYGYPKCMMSPYIHRKERPFRHRGTMEFNMELDCCQLATKFPFAYYDYHHHPTNNHDDDFSPPNNHNTITKKRRHVCISNGNQQHHHRHHNITISIIQQ